MRSTSIFFIALASITGVNAATYSVPAGGNLQAALNSARGGDTIVLAAGASFTGNFYAPINNSGQYITIQSSKLSALPAAGNRVSVGDAANMAKVLTPNSAAALQFTTGANWYRIQGVEFTPGAGLYVQDLIQVGNGAENSIAALPHDIDFDRDFIHGEAANGGKRGIALNGVNVTVENCYISGFWSTWQDTQAIAGWNGPGPYQITNNYLEAATETVAFGGSTTAIYGVIPSDILIKGNNFSRPTSWYAGSSNYGGIPMKVKNHLELKNGQRITVDGNTFENNWIGSDQRGFMLVFTVRTEIGAVPWATVSNIKIVNNRFRHSAAAMNVTGHDDNPPGSGTSGAIVLQNNTFEDISSYWGGDGRLFQFLGANGVTIDHNSFFQGGLIAVFDSGVSTSINFTNNLGYNGWGVVGNGTPAGLPTINGYISGGSFTHNALIGGPSSQYPAGNFFPASVANVGFVDFNNGNFNLLASSPYAKAATDGTALGATLSQASSGPSAALPAIPAGFVNMISKNSGKCADVLNASSTPGTILIQYSCWGGDNQKFILVPVTGGYRINVKQSGLSLDIAGGPASTGDGVPVIQWYYWGGSNQIYSVTPTSDGYFTISPTSSNKCLDVENISKNDGANIKQYGCWGGDNQKWSFVPVP